MNDHHESFRFPLSYAQRRLWFLSRLEPGGAQYNIPANLRIRGAFDRAALAASVERIVARHEALRTVFAECDGEPVQEVRGKIEIDIPLEYAGALPRDRLDAWVRRQAGAELRRPFDLAAGPLLRFRLLEIAADDHVLLATMHHIVADGWSMGVFVREFTEFYRELTGGAPAVLPDLPIQYGDYAEWQRDWLAGGELARQLDYWKGQLAGLPPLLDLPLDRPRPKVRDHAGGAVAFAVAPETTAGLRELCRQTGATLFMALLAAVAALLGKYARQDDIVLGSPVANRNQHEIEGLIGFFVNTLVLRVDLSGDPTFREVLERARHTAVDAYDRQDVPFDQVVEAVGARRQLNLSPLFQVMFAVQNAPVADIALAGLEVRPLTEIETGVGRFDLECIFWEDDETLHGSLVYQKDIFDAPTVERLARHFRNLLGAAVAAPAAKLGALAMMGEAERQALLALGSWNGGATPPPLPQACIHQSFEAQAARTPAAAALIWEHETLSYADLNARANRLAHALSALGAGPDVRVAIALPRTDAMIAALLATLKAGSAYVPIDPAYPVERQAFMLEDSGARILVTAAALDLKLPFAGRVLRLDADAALLADQPASNPGLPVAMDQLAYVIYTSGSTGKPKGVAIEHRSPACLVEWGRSLWPAEELSGVLAGTSICFDLSVYEIFLPLAAGGTAILAENALKLPELPARERVTLINTVPSAIDALLRQDAVPAGVRVVNLAGEPLPTELADRIYALPGVRKVYDLYGPSEDTTYSTVKLRRPGEAASIGRPIAHTHIYVVDRHGQPVPQGVPGELYIGGAGLARGYLDRPELTAEKFIADPFRAEPGARVYRTGDLVRLRADGDLEFLGRIDHQVKIRGFRIELGEIEAALAAHPAVAEAVVLASTAENRDKHLLACVVPAAGQEAPSAAALRAHLRRELPDYLVPSAYVCLAALPLTPNGKIDRKALLAMERELPVAPRELPATPTQSALADIWREVLGRAEVGIHDNFFELGGHSLLATQVATRIPGVFGTPVPLRELFEKATLAELAPLIEDLQLRQAAALDGEELAFLLAESGGNSIPRAKRSVPLPLSFAQERLWFLDRLEGPAAAAVYNIPAAYRLRGRLDVAALEAALNEMVRRHEVLRTGFVEENGWPWQRVAERLFLPLSVEELPAFPNTDDESMELTRRVVAHARAAFDLAAGPLVRWRLLRLARGAADPEHILSVAMHHIVSDGWSTGVIAGEVSALYAAFAQGRPSPLPALAIQYADFAAWQRGRFADGTHLADQAAYWRERLAGAPSVLDLPCRKPRPAQQSYRGRIARFQVSPEIRQKLDTIGREAGATAFMTLLSAFALLLARAGGGDDIVVGSPIANRGQRELEPLIGFFVNTLAFRIDLAGNPSFTGLVERVKALALEAYTHQDLPFEKLVQELAPARNLSHAPLFQAMFVLQNAPAGAAGGEDGLTVETLPLDIGVSHFDLVMYLAERDGGYAGMLEYAEELFDAAVADALVRCFQTVLEGIAADPSRPVGAYPLAGAAERARILREWSRLPREVPYRVPVEALFEEVAAAHPQAPALAFENATLSYAELDARANRLARYLQARGAGPDAVVGVLLSRGAELPLAVLAVLKAGAGYLPIDPDYPPARIAAMLEDSGTKLLVTDTRHAAGSAPAAWARPGREIVCVDRDAARIAACPATIPPRADGADSLAYLLYTSGSTGKPKGVAMCRHALSNLIRWHLDEPAFAGPARTLQFAPYTFDVSFQELFSAWGCGGTLYVASDELRRDPAALLDYVEAQRIERLFLPYVALQQLATVAVERARFPASLREVVTAGEQLRIVPAIAAFFQGLPGCRLHNHYGPSETHVVTACTLDGAAADWPLLPAIGKPLANTEIYLLDGAGNPVPAGVPGELWVGGVALARGYLGQEALTAERFVPNPFPGGGPRLYKTGDLALWEPDGKLRFLGRADNQVKIRGFRIEPGEIEALLNARPEVAEAVVVDVEFAPGDRRLAAYVVAAGGALDTAALRAQLKEKLPEYMVPAAIVALERLPLTSSGKVDRRRLPPPGVAAGGAVHVAPATPAEEVLAALWRTLLKCEAVGVDDDFFALGGHSLLATQLVSRIREAFGRDLPVRKVFETPTVRGLARCLEAGAGEAAGEVPPLCAAPRGGEYPLSFAQERLWFLDRLQGASANYNMAAAVRIAGALDVAALSRAISEIVRRHQVLRTVFRESGGQPVAVVLPHAEVALPLADLGAVPAGERAAEIERRIAAAAVMPFDLAHGPLLKGELLRVPAGEGGPDEHVLVLTMHHIVADNWSSGVFLDELAKLYRAFHRQAEGELASPLPELAVQYHDFACWQRRWLDGAALEARLAYWRHQLVGVPPVFQVSRRASGPAAGPSRSWPFAVGAALAGQVRALCLREGASLYMVLLAAYATLLFRATGRQDMTIGSPIANRHYREIEPLIGFFVNTLALRLDLSGEPGFRDFLKRVRTVALDAYAHQDVPFERIVREVCPDRGEARTPLVQVVFALQNAPADEAELDGVAMSLLPTPAGAAKFDLILSMGEAGGVLRGVFEYDASLFDEAEIAALAGHLVELLTRVVADPDEKLAAAAPTEAAPALARDEAEEFNF